MITDPKEVVDYVHDTFQKQARPASGIPTSGVSPTHNSHRAYAWEAVPCNNNLDTLRLGTRAGNLAYGQMTNIAPHAGP